MNDHKTSCKYEDDLFMFRDEKVYHWNGKTWELPPDKELLIQLYRDFAVALLRSGSIKIEDSYDVDKADTVIRRMVKNAIEFTEK